MENHKKRRGRGMAQILLLACAVYFLLDFPIRFTRAYEFPDFAGIKSFLPFTLGMFFGPVAAVGAALGALLTSLACGTAPIERITEVLCVLLAGTGSWLCWFGTHRNGHVRLESFREVGIYAAMVLGLSALCGGVAGLMLGREKFLPAMGILGVTGLLVGLPVNILLSGIFCVTPVLPGFCREEGAILFELPLRDVSFDEVNMRIEEDALKKKIPIKRVFEIENCLEELYIRIRRRLPDAPIRGKVEMGSTISMQVRVDGAKYNPFRREADEDEIIQSSLKLIRHRALRASWTYNDGQNLIRIVV